ncbi:poly(hydroxyalkanoate) granule-associated protein [compost metagenome]
MAGKKTTDKETGLVGEIEKYSRQIWLAGLGAYSKMSKDGSKLFESLVKDGEKAEKQAKSEVEKSVDSVKSSAKSKVDAVRGKALGKWGVLEEAFDKRLNSAISRLGVPSRNEVKELHGKVEALTKQIEALTGVKVASAKPAAKTTAARPAAKAAAAKARPATKAAAKPAAPKAAAKPAAARPAAAKPAAAKKPAAKKVVEPKPADVTSAAPEVVAAPLVEPVVEAVNATPVAAPAANESLKLDV